MKILAASLVLIGAALLPAQARSRHAPKASYKTRLLIDVVKEHSDHLEEHAKRCGGGEGSKLDEIMTEYGPGGEDDPEELQEKLLKQCKECEEEVEDIIKKEAAWKSELEGKVKDHCENGSEDKCKKYTDALDAFKRIEGYIEGLERAVCVEASASDSGGDTGETELVAVGVSPTTTTTSTTSTIDNTVMIEEAQKALDKAKEVLEAAEKEAAEAMEEKEKKQEEIKDKKDWLRLREAALNTKQKECIAASEALTDFVKNNNLYNPDSDKYKDLMDEQGKKCDSLLKVEQEIYKLKHELEGLEADLKKKTAEWEEAKQNVSDAQVDVAAAQTDLDNANTGVQRRARAAKKNLRWA